MIEIHKNPSKSDRTCFYNIFATSIEERQLIEVMLKRGVDSMQDGTGDDEFIINY